MATGISVEELLSTSQYQGVRNARAIAQWYFVRELGWSSVEVAAMFRRNDHTSVSRSVARISKRLEEEDGGLRRIIEELCERTG